MHLNSVLKKISVDSVPGFGCLGFVRLRSSCAAAGSYFLMAVSVAPLNKFRSTEATLEWLNPNMGPNMINRVWRLLEHQRADVALQALNQPAADFVDLKASLKVLAEFGDLGLRVNVHHLLLAWELILV